MRLRTSSRAHSSLFSLCRFHFAVRTGPICSYDQTHPTASRTHHYAGSDRFARCVVGRLLPPLHSFSKGLVGSRTRVLRLGNRIPRHLPHPSGMNRARRLMLVQQKAQPTKEHLRICTHRRQHSRFEMRSTPLRSMSYLHIYREMRNPYHLNTPSVPFPAYYPQHSSTHSSCHPGISPCAPCT